MAAAGDGLRIVAPFGFYGWGNIGDESTLQGFAQLLRLRSCRSTAWVASRNPRHTARAEPAFRYFSADKNDLRTRLRRRWAHQRASAVVFPGGTPIMDSLGTWPLEEVAPLVRAARDANRPVAFVGAGTERLVRPESRDVVASVLAGAVEHWSVRSACDKERLISWNVPAERITVAADLAWLVPRQSSAFGRRIVDGLRQDSREPLVGVNLNSERSVIERRPELLDHVARFLDRLVDERGVRILFLCSEVREGPTFDKATAHRVLSSMRRAAHATVLVNRYWTPQEMLSIIGCCRLIVSMRYHMCLFSALQRVPFVAIQRSDKVRDLCADIGWECGLPIDSVDSVALSDLVAGIERQRQALVDRLDRVVPVQAAASKRNQAALDALVDRASPRTSAR